MENPKIRIESDGTVVEVYIDGNKIDRATMCNMKFNAEPARVTCTVERYKTDENNKLIVEGDHLKREVAFTLFRGKELINKVV